MNKEDIAEKKRQYNRELYKRKRDHYIKSNTAYSNAHPEKRRIIERKRGLKRQYGITVQQFDTMFNRQEGKCYICKRTARLSVDHNHATKQVRKLLCQCCNAMIGMAREDQHTLVKAIMYLMEDHGNTTD